MAEFAGEGTFGGGLVQPAGFEYETQFVQGRRGGEIPHTLQREGHVALGIGIGGRCAFVEFDPAVALQEDEARVPAGDDGHGATTRGAGFDLDIEFLGDRLLESDGDAFFGNVAAAALDGLGGHVAQHFELVFGTSDQRTQSHGDGQTDHAGAGNADAHGVLEDVGAQAHRDRLGQHAEQLGGARRAERHGNGFGAADGGNHLAADEVDDAPTFGFGNHGHTILFGAATRHPAGRYTPETAPGPSPALSGRKFLFTKITQGGYSTKLI